MVKEIFGYERIRDIPEEELMHLTKTYGYSPLLQFLYSRYLKEKNDRHYPASVARTAIYFSNPHWLHHQLQKNHLDWIEDTETEHPVVAHINGRTEAEPAAILPETVPEQEVNSEVELEDVPENINALQTAGDGDGSSEQEPVIDDTRNETSVDSEILIQPEEIPEETAVKPENIYENTLLDYSAIAVESQSGAEGENEAAAAPIEEIEPESEPQKEHFEEAREALGSAPEQAGHDEELIYPEFDTVEDVPPLLDADTGFEQEVEETNVAASLPPPVIEPQLEDTSVSESQPDIQENVTEGDADDTDGDETATDQPAPGFRPISLPVTNDDETTLSFEPLYVVDYFASQGVKLSGEEESRDLLTSKLKSFTEWLKSMKRIHPEKLSQELDEKTELTIKTVAEHSNEKGEILTETMAEILKKQGLVEKSMEVYEKLSLLYPSKSDYFAAKISALKAIGT